MNLHGGCLCGNIRYRVNTPLTDAGFCHCRICQRSSGAPTVAWLTIPCHGLAYLHGEPAIFQSSEKFQREFCPTCGTQIAFRALVNPATVDLTLCSLDNPDDVTPQYHIWYRSKVPWLMLHDTLPKYAAAEPDRPPQD